MNRFSQHCVHVWPYRPHERLVITRSNFAKANEVRNSKIFEDFAYYLISIARELHS